MHGETAVDADIRSQRRSHSVDLLIADVARRQHGVVSRAQLLECGLSARAVDHRLQAGRLHRVHRGVYAVGHSVLGADGTWLAAVLAAGPDAVLSHRSAAALWGIRRPAGRAVDVTVPHWRRSRSGISTRSSSLPPDEVTVVRGIPVTTVPRTALDLAAVVGRREVERALDEAEVLRLTDALSLAEVADRYPGYRGAGVIKQIVAAAEIGIGLTKSQLEERFLAFLDDVGLPRPKLNVTMRLRGRSFELDCLWRAERLVVELDGHAVHATRRSYERDRSRDRVLQAAGWRVARITWRQLKGERFSVESDLRRLLASSAP